MPPTTTETEAGTARDETDTPQTVPDVFDRGWGDTDGDAADEFTKSVDIIAKDDDEKIGIGAVLVPDRVDHQGDFFGREVIEAQAADLAERIEERDVVPGVMHAVFPEDHIELAFSETLDEPRTVGDRDLPAGTWLVGWHYTDETLWSLVKDKILAGNSIGGLIEADIRYSPEAVPDEVEFPPEVAAELEDHGADPDEVPVWEVKEFRTFEISTVDMPAVPDAVHGETKAASFGGAIVPRDARRLTKAAPMLTEDVVSARIYLEARGHDEEEAKRLAMYLNANKSKAASSVGDRGGFLGRTKQWLSRDRGSTSSGRVSRTVGRGAGDESDVLTDILENADGSYSDELADTSTDADAGDDTALTTDTTDMNEDDLESKFDRLEAQNDDITDSLETIANALTDEEGGGDTDGEKTVAEMTAEEFKAVMNDAGSAKDDEPTVEDLHEQFAAMTDQQQKLTERFDSLLDAKGMSQQATEPNGDTEAEGTSKAEFLGLVGGDD